MDKWPDLELSLFDEFEQAVEKGRLPVPEASVFDRGKAQRMLYVFDTNVISGLMRKRPEVRGRLSSLGRRTTSSPARLFGVRFSFGIEKLPKGRRRHELVDLATSVPADIRYESVPEAAGGGVQPDQSDAPASGARP
jgi:hypothetical protein